MKLFMTAKLALLMSSALYAQGQQNFTVINKNQNSLIVIGENLNHFAEGDYLSYNQNCTLKVKSVSKKNGVLDTIFCETSDMFQINKAYSVTNLAQPDFYTNQKPSSKVDTQKFGFSKINVPKTQNIFKAGAILSAIKKRYFKENRTGYSDYGVRNQDFGLFFGYDKYHLNTFGYMTQIVFTQNNSDFHQMRLEGNINYGLIDKINLYLGINLNKYTKASFADKAAPGLGFQLGTNYFINENINLSLFYVNLNNSLKERGYDYNFGSSGLELGLSTFF